MLDTLKYAKRLQEAGFTPPQAEAQAQAPWEAIQDSVASKQDIALVKQDIELLRQEMNGRFIEVDGRFNVVDGRFRLVNWMIGFNLALTVAVLVKLFTG
jgi:hypothetical protein